MPYLLFKTLELKVFLTLPFYQADSNKISPISSIPLSRFWLSKTLEHENDYDEQLLLSSSEYRRIRKGGEIFITNLLLLYFHLLSQLASKKARQKLHSKLYDRVVNILISRTQAQFTYHIERKS